MSKEKSDQKKSRLFYIGIAVVGPLAVFMSALLLYCYWKGKIDDTSGYNSVSAIIAGVALVVNLVTVILVYYTFKLQSDEIKRNRKDVEFNRALDIIYQQLEYTKKRFIPETKSYTYSYYITILIEVAENYNFYNEQEVENIFVYKKLEALNTLEGIDNVLSFLEVEFRLYTNILKGLDNVQKLKLINIITWNIDVKLEETIRVLHQIYFRYKTSYRTNLRDEEEYQIVDGNIVTNFEKIINFLNADFR